MSADVALSSKLPADEPFDQIDTKTGHVELVHTSETPEA